MLIDCRNMSCRNVEFVLYMLCIMNLVTTGATQSGLQFLFKFFFSFSQNDLGSYSTTLPLIKLSVLTYLTSSCIKCQFLLFTTMYFTLSCNTTVFASLLFRGHQCTPLTTPTTFRWCSNIIDAFYAFFSFS